MYYDTNTGAELDEAAICDRHDDLIDEIYPPVTIGIYEWAPARVLKAMDPVAYRVSVIEYVDQLVEDGQITESAPDIDGAVCIDCAMAIANADTSGISDYDAWSARVEAADATENGAYRVVVTGDENYFGTSACDYCRSSLAGDRIDVAFVPV
jgi:hypothetical protein